ncbi:hypothetical protein OC846_004088 [Tilletia horrida]|uniref:Uncharacterized protein n=1 Tax=Tilletia horrida TaxID=155126 RepID=A0AAN6GQC5_9BASI|nr:hypothetical protein OC846_004088 [Tilletia horrida]KAK0564577.1 hypothetical protein OC861_004224 [Tilletia horrida]
MSSSTHPSSSSSAAPSDDPILGFLRSLRTMINSDNALETATAELNKKKTALRHQPARLMQERPKLQEMENNIKQSERSFAAQEKQCAQLLRSLLQSACGMRRPRSSTGAAGVDEAQADSHGDHKPSVNYFDLLELMERIGEVEAESSRIASIHNNSIAALKGVSALRDILAHAADLSKEAFPPEYFLGASMARDPLARNQNPPMLALEHETMGRRLAKTHLGLLFAAARRDTKSPSMGGHFQFIPSAAGPFSNRPDEAAAPLNPAVSNLAVTPFDTPTHPEDQAEMARRIDALGADLLEVAQTVMETQDVVEHQGKTLNEAESLVQLSLLTGLQMRDQVREAIQTFADLSLDTSRATGSAQRQGQATASGFVAADDDSDDDDDSDKVMFSTPVLPSDPPGTGHRAGSIQPQSSASPSNARGTTPYRVKQEPM